MNISALDGGFTDAAVQSSQAFRAALEAMARPGSLHAITGALPPAPMSPAAGALLLTLCDSTTPLHLAGAHDCSAVRDWVIFHCGAPLVDAQQAQFALGAWADLQPVSRFAVGLPDYPDRSATLIVETELLAAQGAQMRGPGIQTTAQLSLPEIAAFQANRALFPLGFDCFFTCGSTLTALPRSTQVEAA
jgi:alpha-D-ribose 1-methylphosphonate 5-triphosphate synthase subunit PhnH